MVKKLRQGAWSDFETDLLIELIQEKKIISKLDGRLGRNQQCYHEIAEEFSKRNIHKNWKQISIKWKNLKAQFYQLLKSSSEFGAETVRWPFFQKMKALLSDRLKTQATGVSLVVGTIKGKHDSSTEHSLQIDREHLASEDTASEQPGCSRTQNKVPREASTQNIDADKAGGTASHNTPNKAKKRKLEPHCNRRKMRIGKDDWKTFLKVFEEQCEKYRKSREVIAESLASSFKDAFQQLLEMPPPAVTLQLVQSDFWETQAEEAEELLMNS